MEREGRKMVNVELNFFGTGSPFSLTSLHVGLVWLKPSNFLPEKNIDLLSLLLSILLPFRSLSRFGRYRPRLLERSAP